jgi:hypothetical protein
MRRAVARFDGLLSDGSNRKTPSHRESPPIMGGLGEDRTLPEELA